MFCKKKRLVVEMTSHKIDCTFSVPRFEGVDLVDARVGQGVHRRRVQLCRGRWER